MYVRVSGARRRTHEHRIGHHGDVPLSETSLFNMAGDLIFARGEDYIRYVRGLRITKSKAYASIQAKRVYQVELDWSGPLPDGVCTCPHNADGNFCKHLVAVGLAAIDSGRVAVDDPADATLEAVVQAMDVDELRKLVLTLAQQDGGVRRLLEIRATAASGDEAPAQAEFEAYVRNTLEFRGYVDYRRSFEVAEAVGDMLDELEDHLNNGAAEVVRPALLLALTELRAMLEDVDDSSGFIGDQCQRAADLYAQACRLGTPDPTKLATWLVKFRAESPGWPILVLADFVDAFDEKALKTYRRAVAALDKKLADQPKGRHEVDAMLLELADHDGDVDLAVQLLSEGTYVQYGAIVNRLRAAGREDDAVAWIDLAVSAGGVWSYGGGNSHWLSPDYVAETYKGLGRIDDAIGVLRADFVRQPSVGLYRVLLDFAAGVDRVESERTWAYDHARHLAATDRFAFGTVLVRLCLSDGDIDAAWEAADQYGAGSAWRELADRGAKARPVAAADLYRPGLEKDLRYPNSKLYPDIAARLATMAKLYEKGGRGAEFAMFIAQLREQYRKRPALMKALDTKRL
ncbi:SWIM zinc finger family protein [Mycolicibacterium phocaicum]|uniref:Uncharacterized protein n=1 Tax=Mycolicibacterium phocaicum TaxID=319706 RepID=A0A7I7ZLW4_9MYCO|nr:hypothetical protein [Mycolicibacterium phocaicum]TLH72051.1 hypothetical protein C1S79_06090 [Mycolicibacterium phocaicum]BBZ55205.1 hypothetical protein MPHO_21970 [Mycolicibacterium phocaicum]